eukprot:scaffold22716_cov82-Cylindrotheca_fusiformis.AAC.2
MLDTVGKMSTGDGIAFPTPKRRHLARRVSVLMKQKTMIAVALLFTVQSALHIWFYRLGQRDAFNEVADIERDRGADAFGMPTRITADEGVVNPIINWVSSPSSDCALPATYLAGDNVYTLRCSNNVTLSMDGRGEIIPTKRGANFIPIHDELRR